MRASQLTILSRGKRSSSDNTQITLVLNIPR